jgi:hypothetical protein
MSTVVSEQLLAIDSANRDHSVFPDANTFEMLIKPNVIKTLANSWQYYRISLESATIPYSFYNMDSSDGKQGSGDDYFYIIYKTAGNPEQRVLMEFDEGNPTPANIISQLNALAAANLTQIHLATTYNSYNLKFTFTATAKPTYTIDYVKFDFTPDGNDETCHEFLGFAYNTIHTFSGSTLTSAKTINMSFNSPLYIDMTTLTGENITYNDNSQEFTQCTTLAVINLTNAPASKIFYQDVGNDNMAITVGNRIITSIGFAITDRFSRLIRGLDDYQLTLKVSILERTPNMRELYQEIFLTKQAVSQLGDILVDQFNRTVAMNTQPMPQPTLAPMPQINAPPVVSQPFPEENYLKIEDLQQHPEHVHILGFNNTND